MAAAEWTTVCSYARLHPELGVPALVDGEPVALFRLAGGEVVAIGNVDPYTGASVLSRGLIGTTTRTVNNNDNDADNNDADAGAEAGAEITFVASPLLKQRFDLATGACLDDPATRVPTYDVRVEDGLVMIRGVSVAQDVE